MVMYMNINLYRNDLRLSKPSFLSSRRQILLQILTQHNILNINATNFNSPISHMFTYILLNNSSHFILLLQKLLQSMLPTYIPQSSKSMIFNRTIHIIHLINTLLTIHHLIIHTCINCQCNIVFCQHHLFCQVLNLSRN
jgi:hypothetical protein